VSAVATATRQETSRGEQLLSERAACRSPAESRTCAGATELVGGVSSSATHAVAIPSARAPTTSKPKLSPTSNARSDGVASAASARLNGSGWGLPGVSWPANTVTPNRSATPRLSSFRRCVAGGPFVTSPGRSRGRAVGPARHRPRRRTAPATGRTRRQTRPPPTDRRVAAVVGRDGGETVRSDCRDVVGKLAEPVVVLGHVERRGYPHPLEGEGEHGLRRALVRRGSRRGRKARCPRPSLSPDWVSRVRVGCRACSYCRL